MAEDGQIGLLFKEIFIKINKPVKSLNNFNITKVTLFKKFIKNLHIKKIIPNFAPPKRQPTLQPS